MCRRWENELLTVSVLARVHVGRLTRSARSSFVNRLDAELIQHFLLQPFHFHFGRTVRGFRHLRPVQRELILHLDQIVRDRPPVIGIRFLPFQRHARVVVIDYVRFSRRPGLV